MNTQDSQKQTEAFKELSLKLKGAEADLVFWETGMTPRQLQGALERSYEDRTCLALTVEKLQRQNDKMSELLWFWFQKAGHYADMHVNVQKKAVETQEFFLQLKNQSNCS